jgi:hypothetical protein
VHAFINDLRRSAGTDVYGRRMYETMAGWQTDTTLAAQSEVMRDFAHIWQVAEKIVYVAGLRTRVPLHPPGPKPQRVKAPSFSARASWTGNNSGSRSSLAQILRESLP